VPFFSVPKGALRRERHMIKQCPFANSKKMGSFTNPKGIASSSPRLPSLRGYLGSRFGNKFNRNAVVAFSQSKSKTYLGATALRLKNIWGR
jgi:hypothetical protein